MYSIDEIKIAIRIYNYLLEHGELTAKDDLELYKSYSEVNVKELLSAFEEESQVLIRKYDDTIYFIPHVDNEFFGYKRQELKKEIFKRSEMRNIDLYLAMYILIQFTAEFYSGKGIHIKIRDFIQLGELDEKITERLERFLHGDNKKVEDESGIVIGQIAKAWFDLTNEDDSNTFKTRRWYISSVMNFLKKEGLVTISDEIVIIPTSKFNRLAANYLLNMERMDEINDILSSVRGDTDATTR